mgnify:CR=1 FL=1
MNIEKAYEYDILSRNANYTLSEVIVGLFSTWTLKLSGVHVMSHRSQSSINNLRTIRSMVLDHSGSHVNLVMTSTQRDTLTDVYSGFCFMNSTTGSCQTWDGSSWI